MTTSGEERVNNNSNVVNGNVREVSDDTSVEDTTAISNSVLKIIYRELTPESAERILDIVHREQDYEKRAARAAFWLSFSRFLLLTVSAVTLIIFATTVSLHQPHFWSWTWKGYGFWGPFITGVVIGAAVWSAVAAWRSLRAREHEAFDDRPHRFTTDD